MRKFAQKIKNKCAAVCANFKQIYKNIKTAGEDDPKPLETLKQVKVWLVVALLLFWIPLDFEAPMWVCAIAGVISGHMVVVGMIVRKNCKKKLKEGAVNAENQKAD